MTYMGSYICQLEGPRIKHRTYTTQPLHTERLRCCHRLLLPKGFASVADFPSRKASPVSPTSLPRKASAVSPTPFPESLTAVADIRRHWIECYKHKRPLGDFLSTVLNQPQNTRVQVASTEMDHVRQARAYARQAAEALTTL